MTVTQVCLEKMNTAARADDTQCDVPRPTTNLTPHPAPTQHPLPKPTKGLVAELDSHIASIYCIFMLKTHSFIVCLVQQRRGEGRAVEDHKTFQGRPIGL